MSKALLLLMLVFFGIFVFLMCFKNLIIYPLLIPIIVLVVIWYFVTFFVSKKMVSKKRVGEEYLFFRGQLIDKNSGDITYGALAVSKNDMVFYKRKAWNGGVEIIWSAFVPALESYEMGDVDGKHKGIKLSIKGDLHPILIACKEIGKEEDAFATMIGWKK